MVRLLGVLGAVVTVVVATVVLVQGAADTPGEDPGAAPSGSSSSDATPSGRPASSTKAKPLTGRTVVLDPGHQLGNSNFPDQINKQIQGEFGAVEGTEKQCNTTGTATDSGYPEATFTWEVARRARQLLRKRGAKVVMTRTSNSAQRWGPCVDDRGRAGNKIHADVKVSIHADGSYDGGGFHVIAPELIQGWTDDIATPSASLARTLRSAMEKKGFERATYIAGGDGLDVRADLGTLNFSDIPVAMLECGNMRNPEEAAVMTTAKGRQRYAAAIAAGIERWLARTSR